MTYKVHLDGDNLVPYLTGQVAKSPRESFPQRQKAASFNLDEVMEKLIRRLEMAGSAQVTPAAPPMCWPRR